MLEIMEKIASIFAPWPEILAFDAARYVIAASLMAGIVKLLIAYSGRQGRIQHRVATAADVRREIIASARTAFLFSLTGLCIVVGIGNGVFTVYSHVDGAEWVYVIVSLAAMLIGHDAYFYWTHRAMHHRWLFRWVHRTHHKSVTPTAFAAYSFAVPEAIVQSAFMPIWLLLVPMHATALFAFVTIMIVRNVMGHCGFEVHPRGMASSRWLGWLTTTTHHDLHHSTMNHNFGLYFTWWDRWLGTEHPDYVETFDRATISACQLPTAGERRTASVGPVLRRASE